jgi:hypothetical protein
MSNTIVNRETATKIASLASQGEFKTLTKYIENVLHETNPNKKGWVAELKKISDFIQNSEYNPLPYKVFSKGNSKLPFWQFSTLPMFTCPGMGDCGNWCYSFKSWRFPQAFCRQVQNTILVKFHKHRLLEHAKSLPLRTDVRLYVDGDIDSFDTLQFWMNFLKNRSDLKAYGYSKSWKLFIEYQEKGFTFPENYQLNLSSGSKFEHIGPIRAKMKSLPITRGDFIAIDAGKKPNKKQLREIAKQTGIEKSFICPGKCGNCLKIQGKNEHACGSSKLKNTTIIIATH